jgi:predicted ribosome quality control (RQC) complex YloA/Tae2 family protein
VCQIDLDRIIMLTLEAGSGKRLRLYFELVPPFPNMFLTDWEDTVIEPLFKAGTRTRRRVLQRREAYVPPPVQDKTHPIDVTPQKLAALDWRHDPEALSKGITGVSPLLSREMVNRAAKQGSLYEVFNRMLQTYRKARITPTVFTAALPISKSPPHRGLAWFRPTVEGVSSPVAVGSLNDAVVVVLGDFLESSALQTRRAATLRALDREIRKWKKVREKVEEAGRQAGEAGRFRKFGEIIVASLGRIVKGSSEAHLPDIHSPDASEVVIPLDPRLTPQANAEVYFKRAKKALRRARRCRQRLEAAEPILEDLKRFRDEALSEQTSEERLAEIERRVSGQAAREKPEKPAVDERSDRLGIRPRRYVLNGGWVVLVGRSARENDVLTHKYASPGDLWFHARQAHGSHVIIRKEKKGAQVPKEAIIQAARIAAYFSKARRSRHVPVSYTEKRYVKKVKKGPPGLAAMLREKVIFVEPRLP